MAIGKGKPKQRRTTLKTLVDHFSRNEKPEALQPEYEFAGGRKPKRAKSPYTN